MSGELAHGGPTEGAADVNSLTAEKLIPAYLDLIIPYLTLGEASETDRDRTRLPTPPRVRYPDRCTTMSSPSFTKFIIKRPWLKRLMMPLAEWYVDAAGYRKLGLKYDLFPLAYRSLRPQLAVWKDIGVE